MLAVVRTDRGGIVRRRLFGRSVAGKRGETAEPRHARLDPDLADRREARRFVERPDGQVDAFAFDIIEEKRRPAIAAEHPCDMRRTMKDRRLYASPEARKSVVKGKRVTVRVGLGGRIHCKTKT